MGKTTERSPRENSRRVVLARLAMLAVGGYVAPKAIKIEAALACHGGAHRNSPPPC